MRLTEIALATLLLTTASAQAATLVVRATGPSARSFPPGKQLPDDARIALKENDQVVLLDSKGTRTLRGPGVFSATAVASAEPSRGTALAALVEQRGDRRVRIGAVRAVDGTTTHPPGLWYINASRGGTVCVVDPTAAMLWRTPSDKAASMTISGQNAKSATVEWTAGQATQAWPTSLPITDGARYTIAGTTPIALTLETIARPAEDPQAIASALLGKGCTGQVDQMVATIEAAQTASAAK